MAELEVSKDFADFFSDVFGLTAQMKKTAKIAKILAVMEGKYNIHILYACESGSRCWGIASEDSDYDVRFIYHRPRKWYMDLNIETKKDVLELKHEQENFDISGWDIRKTLKLFKKCNPPLIEWFHSPIIYRKRDVMARLLDLIPAYYNRAALCYHYLHMAKGNYRDYPKGDVVWLKKYFYVLRPLLCIRYILQYDEPPLMDFEKLIRATLAVESLGVKAELQDLLEHKRAGAELGRAKARPILNSFIQSQFDTFEGMKFEVNMAKVEKSWDPLNELFRHIIESYDF